jgi:hypothetical protein
LFFYIKFTFQDGPTPNPSIASTVHKRLTDWEEGRLGK